MPTKPLDQLRQLAGRIVNLPTTDEGARRLAELAAEGATILQTLEEQSNSRLALRCRASRTGLQTEVPALLNAYGNATDNRERITRLTQARSDAHYLIQQVLSAARR